MFAVTPPQVGAPAVPPISCDFKKAAGRDHRVLNNGIELCT